VASGEEIELKVTAEGGTSPYRVLGIIGSFESTTNVKRTYTNETDAVVSQEDSVFVFDSNGRSTQCFATFDVDVADDNDPDPTTPVVSVTTTAMPAVIPAPVVLSATSDGFDGAAVTYTFEFTHTGVSMVQNDNTATFTVTDNTAHAFNVTVKATSATEEASKVVAVAFVVPNTTPLNCTLKVADGPFIVGDTVNVKLETTASNVELEFVSFASGVTPTNGANGSKNLVYTTAD
jgi:hypothetical protein